jgi:Carboxypeptidase regulatory-like domain
MNNHKKIIIAAATGILALSILAIVSLSINQGFAQCATTLTLGTYPNKGTVGFNTGTLPVSLSGQLTDCDGNGIGGATITITGIGDDSKTVETNDYGRYSTSVGLGPGEYTIEAQYDGDNAHESSSATKKVTANENTQN